MTRRELAARIGALGAGLVALLAFPPLLYWWRTSRTAETADASWVDLGSARKIAEGEWLPRRFSLPRRNRWRLESADQLVYVRRNDRDITVVSATCPHARCLVRTLEDGFACPCHKSFFDSEGRVVEGPSPRALDRLEWRVRGGRLWVDYRDFRSQGPPEAAAE